MADVQTNETPQGPQAEQEEQPKQPEMCCDGQQTAEEHRHSSPDGKCCIDG